MHPELPPGAVRQAEFWADVGRALVAEKKTRDKAVRVLVHAEQLAPQRIRHDLLVREVVAGLLRQTRRDAGGRELRGLAWRMGGCAAGVNLGCVHYRRVPAAVSRPSGGAGWSAAEAAGRLVSNQDRTNREGDGMGWQQEGPVGGAGPVAFARFPLRAGDHPSTVAGPVTVGPRPFAAAFAVTPVRAKHKKTPTHGVETKETCNIIDGTDEPDSIDEPYEDEE